ncbi:MAG: calcium/sodium antiporter [Acidobacteriota bacterium]|nr:calcium/sodium antiporter [Acidobacteriota bacterium]
MLADFVLIAIGLGVVAKGGDLFVDSSIAIGRSLRVPRFVIGGTLVSLATTTPEAVVSALASSVGDSGIALGNALGSCICNIGFIVGTVAVLTRVEVDPRALRPRAAWMVSAAVLVVVFTWDRTLSRGLATVLLGFAFAYLAWDFLAIRRQRDTVVGNAGVERGALAKPVGQFLLGAALIVIGSRLLVDTGQSLAVALGIPSVVIGLSVVAIGTSLPELVTGVSAARKGVPDLSLGNIIGANVLNLFLIIGLSGTIHPLTLDWFTQVYSYGWLGLFFAILLGLSAPDGHFHRRGGLLLLALYVVYMVGLVVVPRMAG